MKLLSYDNKHIRVFEYNNKFITPTHFQDNILPLAQNLFASTSMLKIYPQQIQQCIDFVESFQCEAFKINITYKNQKLSFKITTPQAQTYDVFFSQEKLSYWQTMFTDATKNFSLSKYYQLEHNCLSIILAFLEELQIPLPDKPQRLIISYTDDFFFIPFEFLYDYFYVSILLQSKSKTLPAKTIQNIAIFYDPDLDIAKEESLYTLKLLEKRSFSFNNKKPDVALVSAHGTLDNQLSCLENKTLEALILEISPSLIIFNSCLLAQQSQGIIQFYIDRGCIVIASPFHTFCSKTIFSPLLRFLTDTSPKSIWTAFCLLKIFYPNIYQYFRIYLPNNTQSL